MPARRPLAALVTAVAVLASGLAAGQAASADTVTPSPTSTAAPAVAPAPGGYAPAAVQWRSCPAGEFPKGFECGTVAVPLDWNDVGGRTITLALTRLKHTTKRFQGVLLVNPGGPGGSGTIFPYLQTLVPKGAGRSYDWIGFDPRGVGESEPGLSCIPGYFDGPRPAYIPSTKKIEKAWIARSKAYAAACGKRNPTLLPFMTTEATAKDMDAIRVALGQEQINYLGFSYGTYLGQVYGTLFPSHLRRAIFDSTVDPRKVWYDANNDQDVAFEHVARVWFGWIAKYDRVYHLGTTRAAVAKRYSAIRDALDKRPVGTIGGDEWSDSMLPAGYVQSLWPALARVFSDYAVKHSTKALRAGYQQYGASPDDADFAAYSAIQCNEGAWPNYSAYKADQSRLDRVAPFLTWGNAWYNSQCLYWPLEHQEAVQVDGSKVTSLLMIGETQDAATPWAGSLEVRRRFPHAALIGEPGGTSHANSLAGNACVDDAIAAYLDKGTLPKRQRGGDADRFCKPLPQPKPVQPAKSGSSAGSARGTVGRYLLRVGLLH